MIKSVFRKIANNFWLFFCLILGSLLITAILAAIPIYTDGALRKMLKIELDKFSMENNEYVSPGELYAELYFRGEYAPSGVLSVIDDTNQATEEVFKNNKIKRNDSFRKVAVSNLGILEENINQGHSYSMQYQTGIEDHIKILEGRMYENSVQDGVLEVIISSSEYNSNYFTLGNLYTAKQRQYWEDET